MAPSNTVKNNKHFKLLKKFISVDIEAIEKFRNIGLELISGQD